MKKHRHHILRETRLRPPETQEVIESKHISCEQCGEMAAMLIFAPNVTDIGRFEDYARKMYPQIDPIIVANSSVREAKLAA